MGSEFRALLAGSETPRPETPRPRQFLLGSRRGRTQPAYGDERGITAARASGADPDPPLGFVHQHHLGQCGPAQWHEL
jgi:hypothetical protein